MMKVVNHSGGWEHLRLETEDADATEVVDVETEVASGIHDVTADVFDDDVQVAAEIGRDEADLTIILSIGSKYGHLLPSPRQVR